MAQLPNITSLTIPESITAITSDSFTDCPRLSSITVAPNNPTYASIDGLLYNKALTRVLLCPESAEGVVSLPDQTDAVPASALSYCANLSTLLVGQDNAVYTSINGNLYSKDASTLVACPGGIGETLTLPKQTTTIGPDALAGITTLKSIVVLGNITTIDPTAFNDQAKQSTTIALPGGEDYETRKQVWQQAGFKNFATPANPGDTQTPDQPSNPGDNPDNPTDPSKPASGFTYKLLEDYTLEASWTGDLTPESTPTIPTTAQLAGVTYTVSALAPKAFAGTALTAIDIPTSITTIGDQAFANCPNLTRIVAHSNTLTVAPTALESCTNLELWCPYNEAETYPWVIGLFATNNHIKAYGLPASQQPLTLEVGQSANLFEPNTLQAPDPSKTIYAYEATCLSVSQEGTITAKAPGTTTISTTLELDQTPLTHTTRTITVVAPSTPPTPEQPETPTPTPPNAQPITPRYPPNLATPAQASAPLYALGGKQPTLPIVTVGVKVPTAAPFSIDAAGNVTSKAGALTITSTDTSAIAEPIRATSITCTENATGAGSLISNLDAVRANTKVTVTYNDHPSTPLPPFALSTAGTTWSSDPVGSAAPFRIEAKSSTHVTFGLTIPDNATFSYLSEPADFATIKFTYGLLAPIATSLTLTSDNPADPSAQKPKVGDTLTAAPPSGEAVSSTNPIYTWYALDREDEIPTPAKVIPNTSSNSCNLTDLQKGKFICCALSDGPIDKPKDTNWTSRPVYSDLTAQVAAGWPSPLPNKDTLQAYEWAELSQVADYLSLHVGELNDPVYLKFKGFMEGDSQKSIAGTNMPKVRIVGINHDAVEIDAQGKATKTAGLTFMAVHSLPIAYQFNPAPDTNVGGWENSALRTAMNSGAIWNTLATADPELTGAIKQVYKRTSNKGGAYVEGVPKKVNDTQDKLWLPSHRELVNSIYVGDDTWKKYTWLNYEGTQYEFFQGKVIDNDSTNNTILKNMNLTQSRAAIVPDLPEVVCSSGYWWQRSCYPNRGANFMASYSNGDPLDSPSASDQLGIVLGFSL